MNKIISKTVLIIFLLLAGCNVLAGQDSVNIEEKVNLVTDRSLYIAGEEIFFSATLKTNEELNSRILYCELITPDGTKIAAHKYLVTNRLSSGVLSIPSDLLSGNYYLRGYTKFMRNGGPWTYSYSLIKIVNPYRNEVQVSSNTGENAAADVTFINNDDNIKISAGVTQFSPGNSISISVDLVNKLSKYGNLSLAIVPEFSFQQEVVKIVRDHPVAAEHFYPEIKGITLTGTVRDEQRGNIIKGIRVNLSIMGKSRDFMATRTDSSGRFLFTIPDYYGSHDIFLCTEKTSSTYPRILVDNDFCSLPIYIPTKKFELSPGERETAYKMAVNCQIRTSFNSDKLIVSDTSMQAENAFYGKPSEIVHFDNYVQLPTLEEYFNGLPTIVKIRKRQGKKYFKVIGNQTALTLYDPLVLVDFVDIDDPEKILAINPKLINRIEIINELYLKGDQTYGGIISFITNNSDFAGINLPSSGVFVNYGFLESNSTDAMPVSATNCPDVRNTLLWVPHLINDGSGSIKVSTIAPETPGKYVIIVRGTDITGNLINQVSYFEGGK